MFHTRPRHRHPPRRGRPRRRRSRCGPAGAATEEPIVLDDFTVVAVTAENFPAGTDLPGWSADGTTPSFPEVITRPAGEETSFLAQAYVPSLPASAAGCAVRLRSFVFTATALQTVSAPEPDQWGLRGGFFLAGTPATGDPATTTAATGENGAVVPVTDFVGAFDIAANAEGTLSTTVTESLPSPTTVESTFGVIGLSDYFAEPGQVWRIDSVSFVGTVSCRLPATGAADGTSGLAPVVVSLVPIGLLGAAAARARRQHG